MAIMFPPGLREFIEVWVGANVATGNEDLGFDSRNPYLRLADDIRDLSDAMKGAISTAGNSLPPRIADEFVAAMKLFVDDNGQNHLQKFSDELRELGSRQGDRSIKLSEAKYQILLEFILMNIELALIAALAVFTGGTSLTEIAIQKARTALTILLLLQRLGRAIPTPLSVLLEAIQEAFVSFAAQLISMTVPDDPDRRRYSFDWKDIGQSAVAGAFAGLFGGLFSQFSGPIVRNLFKDNRTWKEVFDLPLTFVNEGQAETFAEAFTGLIFRGTFTLNPGTFVSAGLSGALFEATSTGAEYGGKWLNDQFFRDLRFGADDINDLPGGRDRDGGGNGSENRYTYENRYKNTYENPYKNTYDDGSTYRDAHGDPYRDGYGGTYADGSVYRDPQGDTYGDDSDSYRGDISDNASVFSHTSDVSSVSSHSSLPDYDTAPGTDTVFSALNPVPTTFPGQSVPYSASQQRPQTASSDDPAVIAGPTLPDPVTPDGVRTLSPGESEGSEQSRPSSVVPKPDSRTTSDLPQPYRPVRTESEDDPVTFVDPAEPSPVVPRDVPHTQPVTVDETPLSSPRPTEIPTGLSSGPGSPDSVDMIMDWEDGQDASEPDLQPDFGSDIEPDSVSSDPGPDPATEALYDRLLTDVFGPGIAANPSIPRCGTASRTSTSSGRPFPRYVTARSTWTT